MPNIEAMTTATASAGGAADSRIKVRQRGNQEARPSAHDDRVVRTIVEPDEMSAIGRLLEAQVGLTGRTSLPASGRLRSH